VKEVRKNYKKNLKLFSQL